VVAALVHRFGNTEFFGRRRPAALAGTNISRESST
jgi:hypothetical protein